MNGYNKVILIGNLTRDPELSYTQSGSALVKFALAINRKWRQNQELKEEVGYFDVVVFGKTAENCGQYLFKGNPVMIEGRLDQQRWEDKEGQKRSRVQVVAERVNFMPKGKGQGDGGQDQEPAEDYYPGV